MKATRTPFRATFRAPSRLVVAAGVLIAACLSLAAFGRYTGLGVIRMPEAEIVQYRDIRLGERADGSVDVADAATGGIIGVIGPGSNGFVKGVMRGRPHQQQVQGLSGDGPPFRLTQHADGRLTIEDLGTRVKIAITNFGPTNAEAFSRLLHK